jgi:hypothetical protein
MIMFVFHRVVAKRAGRWVLPAMLLAVCSCGSPGNGDGNENENGNGGGNTNVNTNVNSNDNRNDNSGGPGPGAGPMSARVDGAAWSAAEPRATYANNFLHISGFGTTYLITMGVAEVTGPGTYSLTYLNSSGSSAIISNSESGWDTFLPGGTGSITFTTLDENRVVGTFEFVASPGSGTATELIEVADGQFNIEF